MRRQNKVRGRDGTVRDVGDGYVLLPGEAQVVELPWMDSLIHDGRGRPAGQKPGFLYSRDGNEQARVDAYREYTDAISNRWQSNRWQNPQPAKPKPPPVFDSPQDALADAHLQYRRDIEQRWRSK